MSTITATDARKSFFLRDCRINPFSPTPFPVSVNQNNELGGLAPFPTPFPSFSVDVHCRVYYSFIVRNPFSFSSYQPKQTGQLFLQ